MINYVIFYSLDPLSGKANTLESVVHRDPITSNGREICRDESFLLVIPVDDVYREGVHEAW